MGRHPFLFSCFSHEIFKENKVLEMLSECLENLVAVCWLGTSPTELKIWNPRLSFREVLMEKNPAPVDIENISWFIGFRI